MAIDFPTSPTVGQIYTYGARSWQWTGSGWQAVSAAYGPTGPSGEVLLGTNSQTGSYTLAASDASKLVTINSSSAATVTVPQNTFSANKVITVQQTGAGAVTISQGTGTTLTSTGGTPTDPILRTQYSSAMVISTATNTFTVLGDII